MSKKIVFVLPGQPDKLDLLKSHVAAYTRKDGTFVAEHDDSRQKAAEYPAHVKNWTDKAHFLGEIPADKRTPEQKAAHKKALAQSAYGKGHSPEYKSHLESQKSGPSKHADANASQWDSLPDDENPKYALQGMSSKGLGAAANGGDDLNHRAKVELASRGLNSSAKWVGFDAAANHHGVEHTKGDPDDTGGHFQTMHSHVLAAAARGELDLNKQAKHELANRGHDHDGNWIGFKEAEKLHLGGKKTGKNNAG